MAHGRRQRPRRTDSAKPQGSEDMSTSKVHARLVVDKKATLILERMADLEGREKQRNLGVILERIAAAFERSPEQLVALGIITQHVAAVA